MDGMDGYHDMEGMVYGDESAGMVSRLQNSNKANNTLIIF